MLVLRESLSVRLFLNIKALASTGAAANFLPLGKKKKRIEL